MRRSKVISLAIVFSQLQLHCGLILSTTRKHSLLHRSLVNQYSTQHSHGIGIRQEILTLFMENESNNIVTTTTINLKEGNLPVESLLQSYNDATIVSPVLRQLFPELLRYIEQYGHPNIPLGCEAGRQCSTLRRLRSQEKLVASDIELLDKFNFTWHSLEDVYIHQKEYFSEFIQRLQNYAFNNDGNLSPPKKYKFDPELGAWVTAVRRLYMVNEVDPSHVQVLNEIGFQWESPRKCGSKFMQQYRSIQERIESGESRDDIFKESDVIAWVKAQQVANLSETRKHYMTQIVGNDWMSL
jgi:hypothetical protein